jgi:hypothetical protein
MNANSSFSYSLPAPASSNQLSPSDAPRITLRDALLQQISPDELTQAQIRAEAALSSPATEQSPSPGTDSPRPPRRRRRRSSQSETLASNSAEPLPSVKRHSRKCAICQHDDRAEIEQSFMHWVSLRDIANDFRLRSTEAIRRHAIVVGLDHLRDRTMRRSLRRIIERAGEAIPTATGVIQAIRAFNFLDDSGRWVEPPRRVIVTHEVRYIDSRATELGTAPASAPLAPIATAPQALPPSTLEDQVEHHF